MNRKSILMTIVAVLFAGGVAWGQLMESRTWPLALAAGVLDADTIYFCYKAENLYPIELGYDVSGRNLHPSYGEWALISKTSYSVSVADYNMAISSSYGGGNGGVNGGAGNAYKTVGSGEGGLLFQYLAQDDLCGLDEGEAYWVYVFILPDDQNIVTGDTTVCKDPSPLSIDFSNSAQFKKYLDLYKKAEFDYSWKGTGNYTVDRSVPTIKPLQDTLLLTKQSNKSIAGYKCGMEIIFKFDVTVLDTLALKGKAKSLCFDDTLSFVNIDFDQTLRELFGREGIPGGGYETDPDKAAPFSAVIIPWGGTGVAYKVFKFNYTTCGDPSVAFVSDTLYMYESSPATSNYWGKDQLIYCRLASSANIYDLLDRIPNSNNPGINLGNSYWYDRDLGVTPFTFGPDKYATLSKKSSIGILAAVAVPKHYSMYAPTNVINIADLKSNIPYHYLWKLDPGEFPCFINETTGEPDSGTMVLIVQDPAIAQDYTAQLCKSSYTSSEVFDMNLYSGLNVTWNPQSAPALEDNYKFKVPSVNPGTYKYNYTIPAGCGPGGTGVFYIKVTNKINTPQSKTVKYCVEKLPATINMNDILGVGIKGLKWSAPNGFPGGFDANTGILDISAYAIASSGINAGLSLDFTVDPGSLSSLCDLDNAAKITIKFVDTL